MVMTRLLITLCTSFSQPFSDTICHNFVNNWDILILQKWKCSSTKGNNHDVKISFIFCDLLANPRNCAWSYTRGRKFWCVHLTKWTQMKVMPWGMTNIGKPCICFDIYSAQRNTHHILVYICLTDNVMCTCVMNVFTSGN